MADSPPQNIQFATKCAHVDKPVKARGMCQSCYRAAKKAEEIEAGEVRLDEETGADTKTGMGVERDLVNDPEAVKEFYGILWSWLLDAQKAGEPILVEGKKGSVRDFKLEARMRESTDQRAMKAATVLGRAYIAERHVEEKAAELPVEGIADIVGGWMGVTSMKKKDKKADA